MGTSQCLPDNIEKLSPALTVEAEKENRMYHGGSTPNRKSRLSPQYIDSSPPDKERMSSSRRSSKHRSSRSSSDRSDRGTDDYRESSRRSSRHDSEGSGHHGSSRRGRTNPNASNHSEYENGLSSPLHHNHMGSSPQDMARAMGATSPSERTEATAGSRKITDDSVQLDLPMADLMAYLQVVANNSSNLPLTRR